MGSSIQLHLGCGTNRLPGWLNVDAAPQVQPDLIHDLTTPLPFADGSVEAILAEDLLEHFDKYQRHLVLADWARVLRVGGALTVQVPDFAKILRKFLTHRFEDMLDAVFGEPLWRSEHYLGHFGMHKWGYSASSLRALLRQHGMEPRSLTRRGRNLRVEAFKVRRVADVELAAIAVPSAANRGGVGRASLSVGEFRDLVRRDATPPPPGPRP